MRSRLAALVLVLFAVGGAMVPLAAQKAPKVIYKRLTWVQLGVFEYWVRNPLAEEDTAAKPQEPIPAAIQALHGQPVAIEGFMIPLDVTPDGVSLFVLNGDSDQCAFGVPPRMTDWILVRMPAGERAPYTHLPTTVRGRLEVGEEIRGGRVTSIYRLAADRVTVQGQFPAR